MFVIEQISRRHLEGRIRQLSRQFPELRGDPIHIRVVPSLARFGEMHAGTLLRERRILFESETTRDRHEFARIFTHELFHFVWLRLGNPLRWSYEELVAAEIRRRVPGELGWSAEWRKLALPNDDRLRRARRWREYACESFCDSGAWLLSGVRRHPEFTLPERARGGRRDWFDRSGVTKRLSV